MCIILDTNCLVNVFCKTSVKHSDFEPVLKWVVEGSGRFVYGGSKYLSELKKTRFVKIFYLLNTLGRTIRLDDDIVDTEQSRIENLIEDDDFDDPHLPAIIIVSNCKLICSEDKRSIPYVTNSFFYPKGVALPKYYTSAKNKKLLSDKYIPQKYKPVKKCSKEIAQKIYNAL